ncbi:MAG: multidrug effflux MFS transporter [Solirubrobacterales bacterium]|nr:multidrug effflux MFS transporter [Solirubrobacterales bacterium]
MTVAPISEAPATKRGERRLLLLLGGLAALAPASMDIYFPALPSLTDDFGVSLSVAQLTVAMFVIGLAFGQLCAGPISDVLGRRRPLLASVCVYACAAAACGLAPTIALLAAGRFFQGFAAAAGVAIGRAVVRDLYEGSEGARFLSRLVLIYGVSPLIAPILGGQLLALGSWRLLFAALIVLATVVLIATLRALPETLPPQRRAAGSLGETVGSFGVLLGDRRLVGYAAALGCVSAAVIVMASFSPYVLGDVYGAAPQVFGFVFAAAGAAMVAASQVNVWLVGRVAPATILRGALIGLVAIGALLILNAEVVGSPVLFGAMLVLSLPCWAFAMPNAIALGLAGHPTRAGAAAALMGLAQYAGGAALVPLVGLAGRGSALPMALTAVCLGLVSLVALRLATR